MGSITGNVLKVSIFGESHGEGIGAVIDGLPSDVRMDMGLVQKQMDRRAPGGDRSWSTKRREPDIPEIISGVWNEKTTGTPLCALIRNTDTRSSDYTGLKKVPRPGHADLTALLRYSGASDPRGGGHFSGRLTAALVFAGAVCMQIIQSRFPVKIFSRIISIGEVSDKSDPAQLSEETEAALCGSDFPVIDNEAKADMIRVIEEAASDSDSVGGVIETVIKGFPSGIGDPFFEGMESVLSSVIFSIPAVKGIEFGSGFAGTRLKGSQNNDVPYFDPKSDTRGIGDIVYKTNNSGGILGGITNGMPIVIRTAVKPTASVAKKQNSVDIETGIETLLEIKGRHDPCIVPRALPAIEAACSVVLLDRLISSGKWRNQI